MAANPTPEPAPSTALDLAKLVNPIHNISYYAPEVGAFVEAGMRGWWMSYFAYRSAPLGAVPLDLVVAVFYNFAPRMVGRAIPSVWDVMSPADALALRADVADRALHRIFGDRLDDDAFAEAAQLVHEAVDGCEVGARPLFAANRALDWPTEPHLALWHGCTLLREYRGDCHNIALAAAPLDPVECHVAIVAHGQGNKASILPIRGWTDDEWTAAERRLVERGWLDPIGTFTGPGGRARRAVETHTSELALGPCRALGTDGMNRLSTLLTPLVDTVHTSGDIPSTWPPPHLMRGQTASGSRRAERS